MAIREILKMGDPRLLRVAQPVLRFASPELHALLQDMRDTMAHARGAGLAAPQIGVDLQVVIFGSGQINPRYPQAPIIAPTVLINPVIESIFDDFSDANHSKIKVEIAGAAPKNRANNFPSETLHSDQNAFEEGWEGCLSVPGMRGSVPRFRKIRYCGFDENGQVIDRLAEGFHARVVQHECDHLQGILYPMRIQDFSRFGFTDVLFPELDALEDD